MIVLDLSFSVLILNFSGLKSSKLIILLGSVHNVLKTLNYSIRSEDIILNSSIRSEVLNIIFYV